jgi:hypothetical protein
LPRGRCATVGSRADTIGQLLEIEDSTFAAGFSKTPFRVHHSLTEHPLLTVEAVARLADALPQRSVEHNRGNLPDVLPGRHAPRLDLSPGDIARTIDTNGCWMVLKNIEQVPEYRSLLDEALDEVTPFVAGREGGMNLREGFLFLSAPNSTTPAHTDHEHNFLLQIRSPKYFHVGTISDPLVRQLQIEKMYAGTRNLDQAPDAPELFELGPGDGIYVPPCVPHWVNTGEQVSVSLSITFRTPVTERAGYVHNFNRHLRALHLSPAPPGRNDTLDRVKAGVFRALVRAKGK